MRFTPGSWLLLAWLVGVMTLWARLVVGTGQLWAWRRRSVSLADDRAHALVRRIADECELSRMVELRSAAWCRVPMTWGTLRPVVLLPADAADWTEPHLALVLRHELGHIARRDCLARFVAQMTAALYWPNPLTWVALRALRLTQEQACDDLVLAAGTPAKTYALELVAATRLLHGSPQPATAVLIGELSTLGRRIEAIIGEHHDRRPLVPRTAVLASLTSGLMLLGCASVQVRDAEDGPTTMPAGKMDPGPIVVWPHSVGGNGNSYQAVCVPNGINWADAEALAELHGGHLAFARSAAENNFVFSLVDNPKYWMTNTGTNGPLGFWQSYVGPWLGGVKSPGSNRPAEGWQWGWNWSNGGGPFTFMDWAPSKPDNRGGNDTRMCFLGSVPDHRLPLWQDVEPKRRLAGFVVEYPSAPPTRPLAGTGSGSSRLISPPPAGPAMNLGPVAKHWEAVQQALLKVDHGLQKATAGDMGGYLDKARAAMSESLAAMAECLAVARAEPDPAPFPAHASAELIALHDQINARVTKDRGYLTTASNVKLALGALQTALTELEQLPSGDEGGARTRLVGSLG